MSGELPPLYPDLDPISTDEHRDAVVEEVSKLLGFKGDAPDHEHHRVAAFAEACMMVCGIAADRGEPVAERLRVRSLSMTFRERISVVAGLCAVGICACLEDFIASTVLDGTTIECIGSDPLFRGRGDAEARVESRLKPSARQRSGESWVECLGLAFGAHPSEAGTLLLQSLIVHRNHYAHGGFAARVGTGYDSDGSVAPGVLHVLPSRVEGWAFAAHALALRIVRGQAEDRLGF